MADKKSGSTQTPAEPVEPAEGQEIEQVEAGQEAEQPKKKGEKAQPQPVDEPVENQDEERQSVASDDRDDEPELETQTVEIVKRGHQHRGVAVEKGTEIDVSVGAADRLVKKGVARKV